ncbi:hypothetical protein FH972_007595 [Carpinus fangiana]|uniref:Uncharacterized protein n=1 Tax=Carpinus fangiana TaxID=176857 RepID=A0A5N6QW44_9ROSI|nr:hypothetical protein FH972_007595 [Carpinus fangiana]
MKTLLTICVLLASIFFSSVIARELAQSGTDQTGNHNNPAVVTKPGTGEPNVDPKGPITKCDPSSPTYKSCVAQPEPKAKCDPHNAYSRCTGTGTKKNPGNPPAVKPGPGKSGNPYNPPVKPGTGKPTDPNNPRYKPGKPVPKNKCKNPYERCNPPEEP